MADAGYSNVNESLPDGSLEWNEGFSEEAIYSVQKMADVLRKGPDEEREFVMFEMQQLMDHCLEVMLGTMLPVICELAHEWSVPVQFQVAEHLIQLVLIPLDNTLSWMIACAAFRAIGKAESVVPKDDLDAFFDLWSGVLCDAIAQLDLRALKPSGTEEKSSKQSAMLMKWVTTLQASRSVFLRKVCARMIGALAQQVHAQVTLKQLTPILHVLLNDDEPEVVIIALESLSFVAVTMPLSSVESLFWSSLLQAVNGDDPRLMTAALRTIAYICEKTRGPVDASGVRQFGVGSLAAEERLGKQLLPTVFIKQCEYAKAKASLDQRTVDDESYLLLEVVAEVFGELLFMISSHLTAGFRRIAIKAYGCMSTCNGPLIRRNCAFNLPGVALAFGSKFSSEMISLLDGFSRDSDLQTKKIISAGFHQSVKVLSQTGKVDKLYGILVVLLEDTAPQVRENIVEHLNETLAALATQNDNQLIQKRFVPIIVCLEYAPQQQWRFQKTLCEQLEMSQPLYTPTILLEQVLPLLNKMTTSTSMAGREAAITAIVKLVRTIQDAKARYEAHETYCRSLRNQSYRQRLLFVSAARVGFQLYSSAVFVSLFLDDVINLAFDKVSSVRICVARFLLYAAALHSDKRVLNACIRLRKDLDQDVKAIAEELRKALASAENISKKKMFLLEDQHKAEQEYYLWSTQPSETGSNSSGWSKFKLFKRSRQDSEQEALGSKTSLPENGSGGIGSSPRSASGNLEQIPGVRLPQAWSMSDDEKRKVKSEKNKAALVASSTPKINPPAVVGPPPSLQTRPPMYRSVSEKDQVAAKSPKENTSNPQPSAGPYIPNQVTFPGENPGKRSTSENADTGNNKGPEAMSNSVRKASSIPRKTPSDSETPNPRVFNTTTSSAASSSSGRAATKTAASENDPNSKQVPKITPPKQAATRAPTTTDSKSPGKAANVSSKSVKDANENDGSLVSKASISSSTSSKSQVSTKVASSSTKDGEKKPSGSSSKPEATSTSSSKAKDAESKKSKSPKESSRRSSDSAVTAAATASSASKPQTSSRKTESQIPTSQSRRAEGSSTTKTAPPTAVPLSGTKPTLSDPRAAEAVKKSSSSNTKQPSTSSRSAESAPKTTSSKVSAPSTKPSQPRQNPTVQSSTSASSLISSTSSQSSVKQPANSSRENTLVRKQSPSSDSMQKPQSMRDSAAPGTSSNVKKEAPRKPVALDDSMLKKSSIASTTSQSTSQSSQTSRRSKHPPPTPVQDLKNRESGSTGSPRDPISPTDDGTPWLEIEHQRLIDDSDDSLRQLRQPSFRSSRSASFQQRSLSSTKATPPPGRLPSPARPKGQMPRMASDPTSSRGKYAVTPVAPMRVSEAELARMKAGGATVRAPSRAPPVVKTGSGPVRVSNKAPTESTSSRAPAKPSTSRSNG
uniref:Uncharacterized protein n=1 Tax=Timspurckia oligopyrenoides TaxID=708627 RepID=A0A7S1ES48_9RHOD|mmetsp:Transcript_3472/g.6084  ORF Transcript_3472/g.6084 Transcript_3472/m.6084 type:complete len:1417 (+) Transcript_3472:209-4459(+)